MFEAYTRTFRRLGLRFKAVEADSGAIGGSVSHEFMVLAETGEDIIASCSACAYAANLERAEVKPVEVSTATEPLPVETVDTPGKHTVEEVCEYLSVPPRRLVKTLVYLADDEPVAALVRGDRELNEVKLANVLSADTLSMAPAEVVEQVSGAPVGFAGPKGLQVKRVVADFELQHGADWVAGANQADAHHLHLDLSRDAEVEAYADLRVVTQEDPCPRCGAPLEFARGIEVGHVFKLGLKYSEAMECKYLDEQGKERPMVMGCYGIGVSRIVAAAIEQNHDARGVLWPPPIAPYETAVLSLAGKKKEAADKALELHDLLVSAGFEVLLDDRDERPGIKFNDADLVGCPMQLVAGDKGLARGVVEAKDRRTGERTEIPLDNFLDGFRAWREEVRKGWGLPG
jgi:prolyl-tRNA synthetase